MEERTVPAVSSSIITMDSAVRVAVTIVGKALSKLTANSRLQSGWSPTQMDGLYIPLSANATTHPSMRK
jgi:hypothetical protein